MVVITTFACLWLMYVLLLPSSSSLPCNHHDYRNRFLASLLPSRRHYDDDLLFSAHTEAGLHGRNVET